MTQSCCPPAGATAGGCHGRWTFSPQKVSWRGKVPRLYRTECQGHTGSEFIVPRWLTTPSRNMVAWWGSNHGMSICRENVADRDERSPRHHLCRQWITEPDNCGVIYRVNLKKNLDDYVQEGNMIHDLKKSANSRNWETERIVSELRSRSDHKLVNGPNKGSGWSLWNCHSRELVHIKILIEITQNRLSQWRCSMRTLNCAQQKMNWFRQNWWESESKRQGNIIQNLKSRRGYLSWFVNAASQDSEDQINYAAVKFGDFTPTNNRPDLR
jgi:hypothetical protein